MILIGLGANLPTKRFGAPKDTLKAALDALEGEGVRIVARSRWYSSAPIPPSDQPRYVNAVVAVETELSAPALLAVLHRIEDRFGRRRGATNAAREIDLDLLAYDDMVRLQATPLLPHPRLAERAFVLCPICDIDPHWRHPLSGKTARELANAAAKDADIAPCDEPATC